MAVINGTSLFLYFMVFKTVYINDLFINVRKILLNNSVINTIVLTIFYDNPRFK